MMHSYSPLRRGALLPMTLLCVIGCALLLTAIAAAVVRRALASRVSAREAQCFWLAESGLTRAESQLLLDPDYTGEAWEPVQANPIPSPARITIRVERTAAAVVRIESLAEYPLDSRHPIRRRVVATLPIPQKDAGAATRAPSDTPSPTDAPPKPLRKEPL